MLDRLKRRFGAARRRWPWFDVAVAVQQRFGEIHGGYLAAAVTLAAFVSLLPLVLVAVAVLGFFSSGRPDLDAEVLDALAIPPGGEAAETITDAIESAEQSRRVASVLGVLGLLWTGLGLVAALQYAYNSVWQVTGRGIRDKAVGLLWLVGAGVLFAGSFAVTTLAQFVPAPVAPLNVVAGLVVSFGMFLWAAKVLPNRDVGLASLVPGALLGAVGFEVLKVVGGIYVPRAVASSSALYGSIGVVFAILAWLFFLGRLIVYAAVLNVVLWERHHGTVTVDLEVPNLPGRNGLEATRDGEAVAVASGADGGGGRDDAGDPGDERRQ